MSSVAVIVIVIGPVVISVGLVDYKVRISVARLKKELLVGLIV